MKPDSKRDEQTTYEKWKYAGSSIPFRYSFGGLLFLGMLLFFTADAWWESQYWYVSALGCVLLVGAALSLFYDIPRRRFGPVSKGFLALGLSAVVVLSALKAGR